MAHGMGAAQDRLAAAIRDRLARRNLSARAAARMAGLPVRSVQGVLEGHLPSIDRVEEICRALDIPFQVGPPPGAASKASLEGFHDSNLPGLAPPEIVALLCLSEGASVQEVVGEMEKRLSEAGGEMAELDKTLQRTEDVLDRLRAKVIATRELSDPTALAGPGADDLSARQVEVVEVAAAAGGGAVVGEERVVGYLAFQRQWLDRHGLDPTHCVVMTARGESMGPTLPDGCSILVNRDQTRRRVGRIYVLRTGEGLVAKRAGKGEGAGWQLVSDHPAWKPIPWPRDAEVLGEVRWMAKTL